MVKFSKELEAQLIPEWKEAFVNYWQLKKHVKKIKLSRKSKHTHVPNCDFGLSVFDPIRVVAKKISGWFHNAGEKQDIVQVHRVRGFNLTCIEIHVFLFFHKKSSFVGFHEYFSIFGVE